MVKDKQPEKTKNYSGLIALGIILSLVAIIYLYSSYSNSYVGSSSNQDYSKNSIVNQIRCEDVEVEYTETVPYTDQECTYPSLKYKRETGSCLQREDNFFSDDVPSKYSCTITNLDDTPAQFSLKIGFNIAGGKLEETQTKLIYPDSSQTFTIERDAEIDSCFCVEINVPTKQVCRDVIKYREVTKYRTEQRCN